VLANEALRQPAVHLRAGECHERMGNRGRAHEEFSNGRMMITME
jgi:hypothetical protein